VRWWLVLLLGCRREPPAIAATDGEVREVAPLAELPRVRVLSDIAAHHGKRVIVEGTYETDPLFPKRPRKGGNLTWVVLDDGTRISRAYGAIPDEFGYVDQRVLVTGTITSGPPDSKMQALMAPHIQVEQLTLANGLPAKPPTEMPAPPVVSAAPALGTRSDRWVQIVGTVSAVGPTSTITFADGGIVKVEGCDVAEWTPLSGKTATVTGRVFMEKGAGTYGLDFVIRGQHALCAGVVTRCGL
jgi:hypothetical protein